MVRNTNSATPASPYRWAVLGIAWLSFFAVAASWYVMPTLEKTLIQLYQVTSQQYRTAFALPFLVAGVLAIAGGVLADRWGIRKTASLGVVVSGLGFIGRAHVAGYGSLLLAMALVGVGFGLLLPNLPKLVSVWFPPREAGLATGIYNTALMGGIATGLAGAPLLPGWTTGNIILGAVVAVLGILFFAIVRDAPPGRGGTLPLLRSPALEGLATALRSRSAWAASGAVFLGMAGIVAFQGVLPRGLNEVYGLSMATGGQVSSLITYLGIVGALTLPALAERLRRRKLFMVWLPISFGTMAFFTWLAGGNTTLLWLGTCVAGYLSGGALPLAMAVPAFLPRVEDDPVQAQHVGGAAGLLGSLMGFGGFVGLPLIVSPVIASFGYTWGFLVATALYAAQAVFALAVVVPKGE